MCVCVCVCVRACICIWTYTCESTLHVHPQVNVYVCLLIIWPLHVWVGGDKCATIVGQETRQGKGNINARGLASRLSSPFPTCCSKSTKRGSLGKIGIGNGFGEPSRRNAATGRQPAV